MGIELVFNELSVLHLAENKYIAKTRMSDLIATIVTAISLGIHKTLRTHDNFFSEELSVGYTLSHWLVDNTVDREERRFLRTLSTKIPYLSGLENSRIADSVSLTEFTFEGQTAMGLGIAYLLEALAISILNASEWNTSFITLQATHLINDEAMSEDTVAVQHAAKAEHLKAHQQWISMQLLDEIRDGNDLWHRREEFFPSLIFCQSVQDQITKLYPSNPLFRQIKKRLFALQEYCTTRQEGAFSQENLPFKASPESQATLKQYGEERTILCPDGLQRLFSWHARLTPHEWRLYFFPIEDSNTMIVGYIGPHLPIVSEN